MSDELFGDIPHDGSADPFADLSEEQEEAPDSSPEENADEMESPSQEGEVEETEAPEAAAEEVEDDSNTPDEESIPFHKHPRFQAIIKERDELRDTNKQILERLDSFEEKFVDAQNNSQKTEQIPEWFVNTYGDNPDLWTTYNQENKRVRDEIKQQVLEEVRAEQSKAQQQEQDQLKWIDEQMNQVGERHNIDLSYKDGKNSLRNEVIKVALEYRPTDSEGNVDLQAAFDLHQKLYAKQNEKAAQRKEVASVVTSKSQGESPKKDYVTSSDIRSQDWLDLARNN